MDLSELIKEWKYRQSCCNQKYLNDYEKVKAHIYGICAEELSKNLPQIEKEDKKSDKLHFYEVYLVCYRKNTVSNHVVLMGLRENKITYADRQRVILKTGEKGALPVCYNYLGYMSHDEYYNSDRR